MKCRAFEKTYIPSSITHSIEYYTTQVLSRGKEFILPTKEAIAVTSNTHSEFLKFLCSQFVHVSSRPNSIYTIDKS